MCLKVVLFPVLSKICSIGQTSRDTYMEQGTIFSRVSNSSAPTHQQIDSLSKYRSPKYQMRVSMILCKQTLWMCGTSRPKFTKSIAEYGLDACATENTKWPSLQSKVENVIVERRIVIDMRKVRALITQPNFLMYHNWMMIYNCLLRSAMQIMYIRQRTWYKANAFPTYFHGQYAWNDLLMEPRYFVLPVLMRQYSTVAMHWRITIHTPHSLFPHYDQWSVLHTNPIVSAHHIVEYFTCHYTRCCVRACYMWQCVIVVLLSYRTHSLWYILTLNNVVYVIGI